MRKFILILFGLFCCLFYETSSATVADKGEYAAATVTDNNAQDNVWRCQREYNADLGLPRLAGEISPAPISRLLHRAETAVNHTIDPCPVRRSDAEILQATSKFKSLDLSVGVRAADYYVFRLRRLII